MEQRVWIPSEGGGPGKPLRESGRLVRVEKAVASEDPIGRIQDLLLLVVEESAETIEARGSILVMVVSDIYERTHDAHPGGSATAGSLPGQPRVDALQRAAHGRPVRREFNRLLPGGRQRPLEDWGQLGLSSPEVEDQAGGHPGR